MTVHKFKDFDSFYDALLTPEQAICERLRTMIQLHFPHLQEKFGYGVPYYHQYSRVCFMYPASFPYSGQTGGVAFGFTRGNLLSNEQGLLELGTRKEVAYVPLRTAQDIREDPLLEILHEAVLLDDLLYREKKRKKQGTL
ncbi:MAG: DUF1801 domain-containing protein [Saprospirales bacterium]|nr:DUF1801 domain-containing protein [Saprospirales bacterium]MBK8921811.1 DUF1801 domain-containing protein [Saprospirales bacterium]